MTDGTAAFAASLIAWQRRHGREKLPWQQLGATRDAYRVWVAEIMLQQTQVAAVIPFYARFVERFPDVRALAAASLDDVMRHWGGLGYYSRARNLHAAACRVVALHDGRFPDTVPALAALPGIGRSTAGAIAAFAYGRRAAILDGNVRRVLARVFLIEGPIAAGATTKRMWALAESLLPEREIERYTQGLMDLGATVCTPRKPACLLCPFEATCLARRAGRETALPERAARKVVPTRQASLLLVMRGDDVLLERRPPTGIWGGLWSLPEGEPGDAVLARFGPASSVEPVAGFVHGFTHFVLRAEVTRVRIATEPIEAAGAVASPADPLRWVPLGALDSIGLPTPIRILLARLPD